MSVERSNAAIFAPKRRAGIIGVCLLALLLAACSVPPEYDGPVKHVILISLDTTRRDHMGFYGNDWIKTPHLDALAAESIVFDRYMTVAPSTLTSHTSLFTGKYPHTHGVPRNGFLVNAENELLPELLRGAGFHTAGFISAFALHSRFGLADGFDHYDEAFDRLISKPSEVEFQNQRSAEATTDAVLAYLDQGKLPMNLFLFVHYFDPHTDYDPPEEYAKLYQTRESRLLGAVSLEATRKQLRADVTKISPAARKLAELYAAEITAMDAQIGRLLDGLGERGILDRAIVLVTSDHGENLWRHPEYFNHGQSLYESTVSAICLARLPDGAGADTRVQQRLATIDVLPTLLGYLGVETPSGVEGEALDLPVPQDPPEPRTRFAEATKSPERESEPDGWWNTNNARTVVCGPWKYIRTTHADTEELYDLVSDPLEETNLLQKPTPEIAQRAAELRELLDTWSASANPLPSRYDDRQMNETMRRLRSLGYAGP